MQLSWFLSWLNEIVLFHRNKHVKYISTIPKEIKFVSILSHHITLIKSKQTLPSYKIIILFSKLSIIFTACNSLY